jgi:hypothetical protein
MGHFKKMLVHVACGGLLLSGFPGMVLSAAAQQAKGSETIAQSTSEAHQPLMAKAEEPPAITELPDSPGAVASRAEENAQQQAGSAPSKPQAAQTQPAQSQPQPQKPVGTAAAEAPDTSGIAASQPAGVAIAPAKQRRVRTIVLRMGALIGAGVAVGSVVALTAGTSSKPPGAH